MFTLTLLTLWEKNKKSLQCPYTANTEAGVVISAKAKDFRTDVGSLGLDSAACYWLPLGMEAVSSKLDMEAVSLFEN